MVAAQGHIFPPASPTAAGSDAELWGRSRVGVPSPPASTGSLQSPRGMAYLFCGHDVTLGKASGVQERSGNASEGWAGGPQVVLAPVFWSLLAERRHPEMSGWLKPWAESHQWGVLEETPDAVRAQQASSTMAPVGCWAPLNGLGIPRVSCQHHGAGPGLGEGQEQAGAGGRGAVPAKAAVLSRPLFMLPPASKAVPPACSGCSEKVISLPSFLSSPERQKNPPAAPLHLADVQNLPPTLSHSSSPKPSQPRPDPALGHPPQPSGNIPIPFLHAAALQGRFLLQ